MRIDILTVVPKLLYSPFDHSILKRAKDKGLLEIYIHDIRDYSTKKHKNVDDYQYGGGAGMVLTCEPLASCIDELRSKLNYDHIIWIMYYKLKLFFIFQ